MFSYKVAVIISKLNLVCFVNQVYNGIYRDSPRIGRYCGDSPPAVVQSSGNTAKVVFRTDGSVSNGGFRATYNSLESAGMKEFMK